MPTATIDTAKYERYDLKSLPPTEEDEGGFVDLRPLPFGMKLTRRDKALKMRTLQRTLRPGQKRDDVQVIELETLSEWSAAFDFAYCIGRHNLTDSQGNLLDFTSALTLKSLDPRVGTEIEQYLVQLNGDQEDEEELEDFTSPATTSSTNGTSAEDLSEEMVPANGD